MPYGWNLGYLGAKIKFRPSVCPLCYLLLNHLTKFNQIWCGTLGHWGCPGGQKKIFQTWSCGISNRWGWQAEQNASNIFILGSNWWPWGEVKRSNIINMSITKIFIPNSLCVFSQIKDRKHIEQNFHSVARVMPRGGTCGCWGESNILAWGFVMAPHRLRTLVFGLLVGWSLLQLR